METTVEKLESIPTYFKDKLKVYLSTSKEFLEKQLSKTPVIIFHNHEDYQLSLRSVDELNELLKYL